MEKEKNQERVEVFIPRGYANEEPNLFVGVNGVNYLLPRGKKSLVPQAVPRELERARKAQEALDRRIELLTEEKA